MNKVTRTRLVKVGNARGIRIPKSMIEELGFECEVELVVAEDHLEVRHGRKPREGWDAAFRGMAECGDDKMLDEPTATAWDEQGWEW